MRIQKQLVQSGEYRIFFRSTGDQSGVYPPVVLVHGMAASSRYMVPLMKRLGRFYRVHALDLPGYGRSQKLKHALPPVELARTLLTWMDAIGLDRANMVGNSYGCSIVLETILLQQHRVRRAVLQGPTMRPKGRTLVSGLLYLVRTGFHERFPLPLILLRDYLKAGLRLTLETSRHARQYPIKDRLDQVTVPTLIVAGTKDVLCPPDWAEQLARATTRGSLSIVQGGSHGMNYSMPGELAGVCAEFLQKGAVSSKQ